MIFKFKGCAIYTGKDTKIMLNSKFKSNKSCCVEKFVNLFELNLKNLFSIQILFLLKESLIDLF